MVSIENTMADVAIRQLVFRVEDGGYLSRTVTRPWPIIQVVLGGLLCAYLMGWVQDVQRIRDLRAEAVPLTKVVVTKQEAWERIHAPRTGRRPTSQLQVRLPAQLVTAAAIGTAENMETQLVLNEM